MGVQTILVLAMLVIIVPVERLLVFNLIGRQQGDLARREIIAQWAVARLYLVRLEPSWPI